MSPLVTCDNPVVLTRGRAGPRANFEMKWDVALGGGWTAPSVQMTLTLSRRHALMIASDCEALALSDEPLRFATSVRVRTVRHALRHVHVRHDDPRLAMLRRSTRAPDVVFQIGDSIDPNTPDAALMARAGVSTMEARYSDEGPADRAEWSRA